MSTTTTVKKLVLSLGILMIHTVVFSQQQKIDSIYLLLNSKKSDSKANIKLYPSLLNQLSAYYEATDLDSMYFFASKSFKAANQQENTKEIGRSHINHGDYYIRVFKYNDAINHYKKAEAIAITIADRELLVEALNGIGKSLKNKNHFEKAIKQHEKALIIAKEINNLKLISKSNYGLGSVFSLQGHHDFALNKLLESSYISKKINDNLALHKIYNNLAVTYGNKEDYKNALKYIHLSHIIINKLGLENEKIISFMNLGYFNLKVKKYDKATVFLQKALTLNKGGKLKRLHSYTYSNLANVYFETEQYNKAIRYYNKSLKIAEDIDDLYGSIYSYNGLAKVYLSKNDYTNALNIATKALCISEDLQSISQISESLANLYQITKAEGKSKEALIYYERHMAYKDSISNKENATDIARLEANFEYQLKEEQLIAKNKKEIANQQYYIYIATASLIVFIIIILLIQRNRKIEKKLIVLLEGKNITLINREKELKNLNTTKNKLFSIIGHDMRGPIDNLSQLLDLLTSKEISDKDFMNFIPMLKKDVRSISFTLNNLLSWGNSQIRGSDTYQRRINLYDVIKENEDFLKVSASAKSITITNKVNESIFVWADENQISVVFRNLISNAIKFTPEHGIITLSSKEEAGNYYIIIKDSGIGISKDIIDTIFNKNTFESTYGTNNEKGTGLGLNLCKEMLKKNGGEISLESELNQGSSFIIRLKKHEIVQINELHHV